MFHPNFSGLYYIECSLYEDESVGEEWEPFRFTVERQRPVMTCPMCGRSTVPSDTHFVLYPREIEMDSETRALEEVA